MSVDCQESRFSAGLFVVQLFDFAGFRHRFQWAKGLRAGRREPLTNDQVAERIGRLLGRTYTGAMVGKWTKDVVPSAAVVQALAIACSVPAGWLAYGEADTPDGYTMPDSDDEVQSRQLRGSAKPAKPRRRHGHG